jgi:hypothetical protein
MSFSTDDSNLLKDQLECFKNNTKDAVSACSAVPPLLNLPIK